MRQNIEKFAKIVFYLTFFVPLLVLPSSFIFPFIVPKILMFRSLVLIMLGCYGLLLYINWQEYKPKFTPLNLALALFFLSFTLSTFFGTDPYHSFWDNHERMLGLFTIAHYVLYYFIGTSIFKTWTEWRLLFQIFLFAGSIVMLICLLQISDPNFLLNQGSNRTASTLGNSIYVSGYGLFIIFASALLFAREKSRNWKIMYTIAALSGLLGLIFGGSRGSLLGFAAGVGVALVAYTIVLKEYKKTRIALGGVVLLGILLVAFLYSFRQSAFVANVPGVQRIFNTTLQEVKTSPRMIAWTIAYESWKERPIFGWGPNNFFYAFNKYYNPRSLEFGYGETWFDNAHNIIMNTLCVQGMFGLLIYLSIFGLGIYSLTISYRKNGLNKHVFVFGMAFLIAHLVQNVTVFENPTSYLYFMVWLAFLNKMIVNQQTASEEKGKETIRPDKNVGWGTIGAVAFAIFILIFVTDIQPARANMITLDALRSISSNPVTGIGKARDALAFNSPHIDDIRSDLARTGAQILGSYYQQLGKDRANAIMGVIYPALQKNLILHPLDIRNQVTLAQLDQISAMINNDIRYIASADKILEDALTHSTRRQQILFSLASLKLQLGKPADAIKLLEQGISDDANISESYWRLAYAYQSMGDNKKAREIIALAKKNNIVFDASGQQVINAILATTSPAVKKK